mgnify:CR=1 FL=1
MDTHDNGAVLSDDIMKLVLGTVAVASWLENHGIDIGASPWLGWMQDADTVMFVFGAIIYAVHRWRASSMGRRSRRLVSAGLDRLETRFTGEAPAGN